MNVKESIPLSQWVARGNLATIQTNLKMWLADLPDGLSIKQDAGMLRPCKVAVYCIFCEDWGNLGTLHLVALDPSQTLLALFLPIYPDDAEVLVYESYIRAAIPQPAFTLRMFDLYGPPKVTDYLRERLHEIRLHNLTYVSQRLSWASHGVFVDRINPTDDPVETPPDPPLTPPKNPVKEYPDNIPTEKEHPEDIPTRKVYPEADIPAPESDDQRVLKLWKDGQSAKRIAHQIGITDKTVYNRLSLMRKAYGEHEVPRRR